MRNTIVSSVVMSLFVSCVMGCGADAGVSSDDAEGSGSELGKVQQNFHYESQKLWPRNYFGKTSVTVCWLNQAGTDEAKWVRDAVERTWEVASGIDFVGWDDCDNYRSSAALSYVYDADIRIRVSQSYWPSSAVGTDSGLNRMRLTSQSEDAVASMRLNFFNSKVSGLDGCESTAALTGLSGKQWPSARQACIESIAVHEFGHAAGLAHEQNRADTPSSCTQPDDGYGNMERGSWDQVSVMNYCNPVWNNDGYLSAFDVAGMQVLYGTPASDYIWYLLGTGSDFGSGDGFLFDLRAHDINGTYDRAFTGDFNGDGSSDIFWYQPGSGADRIWWGKTSRAFSSSSPDVDGTYIPVVGNFNGDKYDDIYWYGGGTSTDYIWFGKSDKTFDTSVKAKSFSRSGTFQPLSGDFDNDGFGDIFWYQPGSGADYIWWGKTGSGSFSEVTAEVSGTYKALVGDFDGDKHDDIMWYASGSNKDYTWWGKSDRSFTSDPWGSVGGYYEPVVGDFDGNGATDIYWNRGETDDPVWLGQVGVRSPNGFKSEVQGDYMPLVGDFDNNGRDDIFWYGQVAVVK